ncbi:UNVERIFIED_CONTAM: cytochrome [Sesamum latifolium]|uniref:(+)-piperitol/(+)-sesamin synthase n=1 Tax=Sesamum latifolium TaxID=2727402 RepID=A0AAW2WFA6_9LAMI
MPNFSSTMAAPCFVYIPLIFALYIFTHHFFHKLRNLPPAPILNLPFIGHLYLLKKPLYRSLANISARYGPVILLQFGSRRVLVVSSPSAAEECLTKNDVIFANRPHLLSMKHLGYNYTSLASTSYGDHWRNLRKISSIEILSTQRLQMLHSIRVDEVKSMIRALNRASEERRVVDMKTVFFELTMNVVMRMIAGKRYYGENVGHVEEAQRFREIVKDTLRLGASNMGDFLPELVEGCKRRFKTYGGGDGDVVAEGKTKTMIEMLLALQEKEPEYYTDALIRSLMLVLVVGGTDTSAGTMEWALSLLLNHPHVLKKAQLEIDNHIRHNRLIDESDIAELSYLRCIVNETLRLCPPGPFLIPHESSRQCTVGGYHIPTGTMLLVNVWAIHNDPRNWEDAKEFKPERFEGLEGHRDGFKLIPFGSGRRGCPGEALAIRMVAFGLGSLIQCFDWERIGKEKVDMTAGLGLSMPKAEPLMAYCKARPVAAKFFPQM